MQLTPTSLSLQKVAENIDDVEEFGNLPPPVMHRLSQILSRRRAVTPRTLDLFLRPEHKEINIYDCASEFPFEYRVFYLTVHLLDIQDSIPMTTTKSLPPCQL